jgi:DNA-binding transcriptional ArsR family regulator
MKTKCILIFQALSDPTRQKILELLRKKEMNVTEICKHFNMTQPSISHHLDILKRVGLVKYNKKGKEVYYTNNCCSCIEVDCKEFFKKMGIAMKDGTSK